MEANYKVQNQTATIGSDQACIVMNWNTLNEVDQMWGRSFWVNNTAAKYPDQTVAIFRIKSIKK